MPIQHIAGYKFISLTDLPMLQSALREQCQQLEIKGTILLSGEGVNINLAGEAASIAAFLSYIKMIFYLQICVLSQQRRKYSVSPFKSKI